jgi:hypothetical protein
VGICPSEPLQHLVIIGWLPQHTLLWGTLRRWSTRLPAFSYPALPFRAPQCPHVFCPHFAGPGAPQCPRPPARDFLPCPSLPSRAPHWPMSPAQAFVHCPSLPVQVPPNQQSPTPPARDFLPCPCLPAPSAACLFSLPPRCCCSVRALFCFSLQQFSIARDFL